MTLFNAKHSGRSIPLFSAVAAVMSLLTAAAGPFAQTVKVVRVEPTSGHAQISEFELVVSAIDAAPRKTDTPKTTSPSQHSPDQSAKITQPLSGHWESAAQLHVPLIDGPAQTAFVIPVFRKAPAFETQFVHVALSRQVPIKFGRAPPLA